MKTNTRLRSILSLILFTAIFAIIITQLNRDAKADAMGADTQLIIEIRNWESGEVYTGVATNLTGRVRLDHIGPRKDNLVPFMAGGDDSESGSDTFDVWICGTNVNKGLQQTYEVTYGQINRYTIIVEDDCTHN